MNLTTKLSILAVGLAAALAPQSHAATWGGGTGDWNSAGVDNWGLGIGAYPGDGTHEAEPVDLTTGGSVNIAAADTINLTGSSTFQFATTSVHQSGGSFTYANNVRVGNAWNLSGGSMTFTNGMKFYIHGSGAEVNVSGGSFLTNSLVWSGPADISVSGGSFVDTGVLDLTNQSGSLSIIGSSATEARANTIRLAGGTGPKTANFTFDNSGVTYWEANGGSATTLFLDSSSFLNVDLGSYDATGGSELFVYNIRDTGVSGTFDTANTNVTGDSFGGAFSLGASAGSLNPGEYFIDYKVDSGDTDGAVVLYANNAVIPEPSTFALMGISLLVMTAFVRRKRV